MAQLNYHNFIRWYSNTVADDTINLPRLSSRQAKAYMPVLAIGELFAFYMNLEVPFNDGDFAGLRLDLVKNDGTITQGIAALVKDEVSAGNYNMYASGNLPVVGSGIYQFRIFNTVSGTVKCVSNYIHVIPAETAEMLTVRVRYRNSRDLYKFRFIANAEFYNIIRLHLGLKEWEPEGNLKQYRAVSTGKLRNEKYELDRVVKLETYYFDDAAHEAMTVLCAMDDIELNDRKYLAKSIYKPAIRQESGVSKGEAEFYDTEFSKINKYGV